MKSPLPPPIGVQGDIVIKSGGSQADQYKVKGLASCSNRLVSFVVILATLTFGLSLSPTEPASAAAAPAQVSVGGRGSCALSAAGSIQCWGNNEFGQLGNGTNIPSTTPVNVSQAGQTFSSIASGDLTTCGLNVNGQAYCWGLGNNGRLGNGGFSNSSSPVPVSQSGVLFSSLVAGVSHECALSTTGQAYCWGAGGSGQLGNGSTSDQSSPVAVNQSGVVFTTLGSASSGTCGLTSAGQAYCWGSGLSGQLGNGANLNSSTPVLVSQSGLQFSSITGGAAVCALTSAGQAYCWGDGGSGRIGNGATANRNTPTAVTQSGLTFSSIFGFGTATCALTFSGQAYCWGWNGYGQLGDGTRSDRSTPTAVPGLTFSRLATGAASVHACGITGGNSVTCWGARPHGRLGNETMAMAQFSPKRTNTNLKYIQVTTSQYSSCGLTSVGQTYCWGSNSSGRLGNNTSQDSMLPVAVNQGGQTYTAIASGAASTCGLTSSGQAYCWGAGSPGNLGNGASSNSFVPVAVTQGGQTYVAIALTNNSACGLASTGIAYCWGNNSVGQLGNGNNTSSNVPVAVNQGALTFGSISGGWQHMCALTTTGGKGYCWGSGGNSRLGNGSTTDQITPVAVSQGGLTFASIQAGDQHSCALDTSGQAYCWGISSYGIIGDGTGTNRPTPTAVSQAGLVFVSINTMRNGNCGRTQDGRIYCWGYNLYGQLADGSKTNRSIPSPSGSGQSFSALSTGSTADHMCGIDAGGTASCWGQDFWGQLNVFTGTDALVPEASWYLVDVGTGVVAVSIDPTFTFTVAGSSSACNGVSPSSGSSSTAAALNLGATNGLTIASASQSLSASTNAATGFVVFVRSSGPLSNGVSTIADVLGTNASPGSSPVAGSAGFGYSISGTARFSASTYAKFTPSNEPVLVSSGPTTAASNCLIASAASAPNTPSGAYTTTISYTAVPSF